MVHPIPGRTATADHDASQVGMQVLKEGGNAVDAAAEGALVENPAP
jgi:gamma-glutamyltranspeptidase